MSNIDHESESTDNPTPPIEGPPQPLNPVGDPTSPAGQDLNHPAPQPATPNPLVAKASALARSVGGERVLTAALTAAIVYAAAWLLSMLFTCLALVAAADSSPSWSWAFEAPAQLVALALGGIFTVGVTVMGASISVSLVWLPLVITAVVLVGIAWLSRRDERVHPSQSRAIRWVLAVATGLTLALLVVIIAAVIPIRYNFGDASTDELSTMLTSSGTGSAVSVTAFFGALILGAVASYIGRTRSVAQKASASALRFAISAATRAAAAYVAIASLLLVIVLAIYSISQAGFDAVLTAFLWLPTAVLDGLGFVNLAPITLSGSSTMFSSVGGAPSGYWLPTTLPAWGSTVVIVINLAVIAIAGIVLALSRRNSVVTNSIRWFTTVATFAVLGVVVSLLGTISLWTSVDMGSDGAGDAIDSLLGGSASTILESVGAVRGTIGLAAWTFIIFAILGALVEAAAVYLAPQLIPVLPASLVARLTRIIPVTSPVASAAVAAQAAAASGVAVTPAVGASLVAADGSVVPAAAVAPSSVDVAADASANAAVPVGVPMTPERKRRIRIILASVGGAVLLVIAAAVAISVINTTVYSPKHQVESYLDSLIDGDATGALASADTGETKASRVLLTDEVLAATEGGISDYTITDVETSGNSAEVTVEIEQDGETYITYYSVARSGSSFLVFDNWKLRAVSLPSFAVSVPEGVTELDVNGVTIDIEALDAESGYVEMPVYPGVYEVSVASDNEYLASEPQTITVLASEDYYGDLLSLDLEPTEAFADSVQEQIETLLTSCVEQKQIDADGCPIYSYSFYEATDIVWTIDQQATFTLGDYGDGEWYVQTEDYGSATLTYTASSSYSEPTAETVEVEFSISGDVEMVDGAPVYTYGY